MNKLKINTDGGARGNPGPAAIGVVIQSQEQTTTIGKYIGKTTNNVAEYSALVEGLKAAQPLNPDEINFFLDSELVVKQLKGEYKVKDKTLHDLWVLAKTLEKKYPKVTYTHVPRTQNKDADKIVNEVLDSTLLG